MKLSWLERFLIKFKYCVGANMSLIGGPHWLVAYEYGANKVLFDMKELCKCGHRDYRHLYTSNYPRPSSRKKCDECPCEVFQVMDNLDWVEYSDTKTKLLWKYTKEDLYDYFRIVKVGEGIRDKLDE